MAPNKRSKQQRIKDRETTSRMYRLGYTHQDIANVIGVSRVQVTLDIKAITKVWRESTQTDMQEARAKELAAIDALEATAWEDYERSKEDKLKHVETNKRSTGEGDSFVQETVSREEVVGDPRFLAIVDKCIDKRCRIYGLEAPTKMEVKQEYGLKMPKDEDWADGKGERND